MDANNGRPLSNRPLSSVPIPRTAIPARPITQQGLAGLRPVQSSYGPGMNRMYRDKRFYLAQIQKQVNATRDEMTRIMKETKDLRIASINLPELEKTAKNMARTLSEKQVELSILNMILDLHLSKTNLSEIQEQSSRIERKHQAMAKDLEQGYQRNNQLERELTSLKEELAKMEHIVQQKVNDMGIEEKEMYFLILTKNKEYLEQIHKMQCQIKEKEEYVIQQNIIIAQSEMKQKFYEILLQLKKVKHEKDELQLFLNNTKTPEQERQILLEQLKKEKLDIEALNKVKASLENQIEDAGRKSMDLDRELDGKDNARLQKNKELRERGEHMEAFITNFDHKANESRMKIMEQQQQIEMALECITEMEAENNLKDQQITLDDDSSNEEHWQNKYLVLKKNIDRGAAILKNYQDEIKIVRNKKEKILEEHKKYMKPADALQTLIAKKATLLEHQAKLQATLESTKSAVVEAERTKKLEMRKIEDNEELHHLMKLDMEIKNIEMKKIELLKQIEVESRNEEYDAIMTNIGELLKLRNEQLIISLRNKLQK